MGQGRDEDRPNPKRRKLDFNPLRNDDRFGHLPSRSRSRASTPRGQRGVSTPRQHEFDGPEPGVTEEDANALDRDWYAGDEFGHTFGDDTHNPFGSYNEGSWVEKEAREKALIEKKAGRFARMSARHTKAEGRRRVGDKSDAYQWRRPAEGCRRCL
jgi:pre-mRNA-splicing factor ATP-dependent RNA helicase DHX38/PRP16